MPQTIWDLYGMYLYVGVSSIVFIAILIDCVRDQRRFLPRKWFNYD